MNIFYSVSECLSLVAIKYCVVWKVAETKHFALKIFVYRFIHMYDFLNLLFM